MVLPNGWVECYTEEGYKYYWSEENSESCWINPNLLSYQKLFEKLKSEAVLSRLAMGGGTPSPSPKKQAWSESNVISGDFNQDVSPQNDKNAYARKQSSPREFKIEKNEIYSYLRFHTSKKIEFEQFRFNNKLNSFLQDGLNVNSTQPLYTLENFYKSFKNKKLILKEIKDNLIN
jgi:hypothetical protein